MSHHAAPQANALILDHRLSLSDAGRIARGELAITLSDEAMARCQRAHDRLGRIIAEDRHVYGITTGFGPLANRLVGAEHGVLLQQNLVHHLASGVGPRLGHVQARAIVLARLMSILQGVSGASAEAINRLVAVLNSRLAPAIPAKGTVGASGDLTPLAHMVLCLQGRGEFIAPDGTIVLAEEALRQIGYPPLDLARRDGLALVNGTSAMTGIAALNALAARRAIDWSVALTAGLAEVLGARVEAWHPAFAEVRPHPGQAEVAASLRARVSGSARVVERPLAMRRLTGVGGMTERVAGQDAYTLRCAPQVIGAVADTAQFHDEVVARELQSATDNPIFPGDDDANLALHGGNFMGQHVGLASDALSSALVVLAGLCERQIARLTDETLNRGLPAFLLRGPAGLNSGFMGAQVTATALLAEMRATGAASIHSISTNGANQDVVSMGTIAARLVADKLEMLFQIQAILAMTVTQAIDLREIEGPDAFSPAAEAMRRVVRRISPALTADRPLGREIEAVAEALSRIDPPEA
jgi:tyrosine ammonia-lyase